MKILATAAVALGLWCSASPTPVQAQALVDKGFIDGWNLMVDPAFGNGCLIQTIYEDLSVVRLGYDALNNRGYFAVINKAWGGIEKGKEYPIRFDLDGEDFNATAIGLVDDKIPGAIVFFKDREFVHAIAQKQTLTVFGQNGQQVMAIDLTGTAKALEYARECQKEQTG